MDKETFNTIVDVLPEPASSVVKAGELFLTLLGYFSDADPVGDAIQELQAEIDAIVQTLGQVNERLNDLTWELAKVENQGRVNKLSDISRAIASLGFAVGQNPTDTTVRAQTAYDAGAQADRFLSDPDVWLFTDVKTVTPEDAYGNPQPPISTLMPADFRTYLALPVYMTAIATWLTAIHAHASGDFQTVNQYYGTALQNHINAINQTLLPELRARVTCRAVASTKYADAQGNCVFDIVCDNAMTRESTAMNQYTIKMAETGPSVFCTCPADLGGSEEEQAQAQAGGDAFKQLVDALTLMATTGNLTQGQDPLFDQTKYYNDATLYGVNGSGDLIWYKQGPSTNPNAPAVWQGPAKVQSGWNEYTEIVPAGGWAMYGVASNGDLNWYYHSGAGEGTPDWKGPLKAGEGWNRYRTIFSGGDGIVYGIQPNGDLFWYCNAGFRSGGEAWTGPVQVGTGWQRYQAVFSAGQGIIYGIDPNGALQWYCHQGFKDGSNAWTGPLQAGTGWQNFSHVFSVGGGVIYALQPDGQLLWYLHADWQTGPSFIPLDARGPWVGPIRVAQGWKGFRFVFGLMPAAPVPPS